MGGPDQRTALHRRAFLQGAAGGALALGLSTGRKSAGAAEAPPLKIGDLEVRVVSDGYLLLPSEFLAPEAPKSEREALLKAAGHDGEQYQAPTNLSLIRTPTELILVDAGSGPNFMPSAGKLRDNLQILGLKREDITKVVFTHGHPDHLWGVVDELDELAFPKANYVFPAAEWDFWQATDAVLKVPSERAGFVTGARRSLTRIKDKVTLVKPGDEVTSGIRTFDTAGHTQGHVSLEIHGGEGLLIVGDALTHPLISFAHPEWRSPADHEPDRAAATRNVLLDRLATDRIRFIGFHLPHPGVGQVERKDGNYQFVPV